MISVDLSNKASQDYCQSGKNLLSLTFPLYIFIFFPFCFSFFFILCLSACPRSLFVYHENCTRFPGQTVSFYISKERSRIESRNIRLLIKFATQILGLIMPYRESKESIKGLCSCIGDRWLYDREKYWGYLRAQEENQATNQPTNHPSVVPGGSSSVSRWLHHPRDPSQVMCTSS